MPQFREIPTYNPKFNKNSLLSVRKNAIYLNDEALII